MGEKQEPTTIHKVIGAGIVGLVIWAAVSVFGGGDNDQPVSVASASASAKGIGISLQQVSTLFAAQNCHLEKSTDTDGQERWMGQAGLVICEAIGSSNELTKVFLLHGVAKDDPKSAMDAMLAVDKVIKAFAPNWEGSGKWMLNAIKANGDSTVRDGRQIEVKMMPPMGLAISVQASK